MSTRRRLLATLTIPFVLLLLVALYQTTQAGCCSYRPFAGDTAVSIKWNYRLDTNRWQAYIESRMDYGTVIDTIGWTSWHVYEKCNGFTVDYTILYPVAAYNASSQSRIYNQRIEGCGGERITGNKGFHQFVESGYPTIYPWVHYTSVHY